MLFLDFFWRGGVATENIYEDNMWVPIYAVSLYSLGVNPVLRLKNRTKC